MGKRGIYRKVEGEGLNGKEFGVGEGDVRLLSNSWSYHFYFFFLEFK